MTSQKKGASADSGAGSQGAAAAAGDAKRKSWVKRTPTEIILEQVAKQKEKVEEMKKALQKEESELKKMQDATKLLGAS